MNGTTNIKFLCYVTFCFNPKRKACICKAAFPILIHSTDIFHYWILSNQGMELLAQLFGQSRASRSPSLNVTSIVASFKLCCV